MNTATRPARVTLATVRNVVGKLEDFRCNETLRGTTERYPHTVRAEGARAERYWSDYHAGRIAYVVVSYATPIMWVLTDGTLIDASRGYSRTTTRHASACYPLHYVGDPADMVRRPTIVL